MQEKIKAPTFSGHKDIKRKTNSLTEVRAVSFGEGQVAMVIDSLLALRVGAVAQAYALKIELWVKVF